MKFTDRAIKALKPQARRYEVWEDARPGFGIRVTSTGIKSWVFIYRFDGKPRRMTLGRYPAKSLAQAHLDHDKAAAKLERGIDPALETKRLKLERMKAQTVEQLAAEYLELWAIPHKRSWRNDERILRVNVLPILGTRKARDIKRRHH